MNLPQSRSHLVGWAIGGQRRGVINGLLGNRMITERPAPTRERILDAAVELFGRQGYSATSVGEIESGVEAVSGS